MMDEDRFWKIIEDSRRTASEETRAIGQGFMDAHERTLADELHRLTPADIAAFDARMSDCVRRAYRWDLWAVAYWMHGGCSDDGFLDFRACLVSLGCRRYVAALQDPDSLAEIVGRPDTPDMQSEGFAHVASKVHEQMTGSEMPLEDLGPAPDQPAGDEFDFDDVDEMRRRFPKLLAKMPEMGS